LLAASAAREVSDNHGGAQSAQRGAAGRAAGAPIQLVRPDATHTLLEPVEEGLAVLARIREPVHVVSVVGPYHSGKSFLLNQLLGVPTQEGFNLGQTTRATTEVRSHYGYL
jgi:hypothetical protein